MPTSYQKCSFCGKSVFRDLGRMNENKKRGWRVFCSQKCLGLSRVTQKKYICARPGCDKGFTRTPSDLYKSKVLYCSHKCAAFINNLNRLKRIRTCSTCGKEFTENRIYCSNKCIPEHESKYTKEIVLEQISKFYVKNERIPLKREMYGCYKVARKYFGTWNNAIKAAGYTPNPVMFAHKYIAKDGDKCDSLAEKIIDDYLSKRNIKHIRNFPYPGNMGFTVDFKVGKNWVEFFGLSGQLKKYDELKRKKIALAKEFGLDLIKIYPKDLFISNNLSNILKPLMPSH